MEESTDIPDREKLNFSAQQAREAIYDDLEGFEVVQDDIVDQRRWSTVHYVVIKRLADGKFFADSYSHGSTESQDERPWEYDKPDFTEVFQVEKTVIVFE